MISTVLRYYPDQSKTHLMVAYYFGSTAILAGPIKNIQAGKISDAFLKMHKILKSIGLYIMDNDCYSDLK